MTIHDFANNLEERNGIFFAKNQSQISYPEEGNSQCAQIEENSFWFAHRNECIAALVSKFAKQKPFFDIGGGNGFVAKKIQSLGNETVLVEPGLVGCLNGQKRDIKHLVCSTLEDAGFRPESIPSAGMFDVVEHIEDDVAFLKNIYHYLEKNAVVFITVPAYKLLWSHEDVYAGHFRRYTVTGLADKLKKIGFQMLYSGYIFSMLPLPILLTRSLPSWFTKPKPGIDLNQAQATHANKGFLNDLANKLWNWELEQVKNGREIGIGGSCLVAAKKV
ncbi:MAG: hypothetical protein EAZ57_11460 [Cytophagales bacterium]|nr:MAG: hypothetical protein EAZ67_12395 [Cytophagales bacterium]TAF59378.1 MAG: hypothetical protein EAZ57_11460 [Cytophagales bacterium]